MASQDLAAIWQKNDEGWLWLVFYLNEINISPLCIKPIGFVARSHKAVQRKARYF